ncbi:SEC-C metal-binding domain-containing protein [Bacillus sp. FJAT-29814]|uniref:SEC-C metal-binding domain-containing protein n=1 Tax=Bacillus sp. FJAT-29814 TaxID=1729688 RepID=UPI0008371054|nr:SEC-C metal-binding domain-containing protein [Bacillus sp. FJAT-29814]
MSILAKLNPFLTTDDLIVLDFVLRVVREYPFVPEEWTEVLLNEATESKEKEKLIIPRIDHFPFNDKAVEMLIEGYSKADLQTKYLYLRPILGLRPETALKNKWNFEKVIDSETWALYELLVDGNEEELRNQYESVLEAMEKELYYNSKLFRKAQLLAQKLAEKGGVTETEIDDIFQKELDQEYFSYRGILNVYIVGLLRLEKHIPLLTSLLIRDEDILLEQASASLQFFQTEQVVDAIAPHLQSENYIGFTVGTIGDTFTPKSVEVLKKVYWDVKGGDNKAIVIEALCKQLSPEVSPEIEDFMNAGYDQLMYEPEELAYGFYKVMGVDHPNLEKWKQITIERDEEHRKKGEKELNSLTLKGVSTTPARSEKIGRNDPCPCGSGKKYKKCCGANK